MKKIFFLNSTLNIGGAEKMFYETVKHLNGPKFSKKVCCLYGPGKIGETLISEGMDLSHSLMKNKHDMRVVYKLFCLFKKEKPGILCIESSPLTLFWGFVCGKMLGIPSIVTFVHSMRKPGFWTRIKTDIINRIILRRLDRIGVASQAKLESLAKEYKLDRHKLILVHNGIDISRFNGNKNKNGLKQSLGISKNEKIVGMVGRLVNEKAYDVFLKSAGEIIAVIPESKFLIVGDGKERQSLERLAIKLGIKDKVIFLGERQDIPELISLFDVAVLSSRVESFPIALLEYMACGKCVVATAVGGVPEMIKDGANGALVKKECPEDLAEKLVYMINNKKMRESMGINARRTVEKYFTLDKMIADYRDFFEGIRK